MLVAAVVCVFKRSSRRGEREKFEWRARSMILEEVLDDLESEMSARVDGALPLATGSSAYDRFFEEKGATITANGSFYRVSLDGWLPFFHPSACFKSNF